MGKTSNRRTGAAGAKAAGRARSAAPRRSRDTNPRRSRDASAQPDSAGLNGSRQSAAERDRDPVRTVVLELWRSAYGNWRRGDELMAQKLRRHKDLTDGQRDQLVGLFHGMVVHTRKIDLALDAMQLPADATRHRTTLAYTAWLILKGWQPRDRAELPAPGVAWFEPAAIEAAIAAETDPIRRLGLEQGLPDFLAARLVAAYGEAAHVLAAALAERAPLTLRANTLKTTREELLAQLSKMKIGAMPTAHAPQGVTLTRRMNPFKLTAFKDGWFEVQDESSQLAAEIVAPPPGGLVIDFCAGAGGKSLALGALMKNKGRLIAVDTQPHKLLELRKRAARAGLTNLQAIAIGENEWPAEIEALRGKAARVLVDVPCSGSGALRRNPEGRWRMTPEDLERLPGLQRQIAARAMALVAPGGRLIYATCSILPEENEQVVESLLQSPPDMTVPVPAPAPEAAAAAAVPEPAATADRWEPVLVKEILGKTRAAGVCDPAGKYLKLLPSVQGCDGFFAAVLRRTKRE